MRVGNNNPFDNKSSFFGVEKDLKLIATKLMQNQNLMKLLYYTQPDCLKANNLTSDQIYSMVNEQIKIVPKLVIDEKCPNYIILAFDSFYPNPVNPQYRDFSILIHIICNPDHWNMGDFQLRPYKIAGEIDGMLNETKLTGIGELQFTGAADLLLNSNLMGLTLTYKAIHGVEDTLE